MIEALLAYFGSMVAFSVAYDDPKTVFQVMLGPVLPRNITPTHDKTYGGLCNLHKEDGWK